MRSFALFAVVATQLYHTAAHSWVERLRLISGNGAYTGDPGFSRGNVLRTSPGFSDVPMVYMIGPTVKPTDQMCRQTQQNPVQTDGSPRLKAPAGSFIALQYQENGHVTLPDNQKGKPPNRGNVFIYGTSDPKPDENFAAIHRVWNADGTGGDKRGRLLATQNYDDGQCYQINGGPISKDRQAKFPHQVDPLQGADLWCQNDIALPQGLPAGKPYTLYWVWDWPTAAGVDPGLPDGKVETYTTCIDVDIIAGDPSQSGANADADVNPPLGNGAVATLFKDLLKSKKPPQAPQPQPAPQQPQKDPIVGGVKTVFETVYINGPAPTPHPPGRRAVEFRG